MRALVFAFALLVPAAATAVPADGIITLRKELRSSTTGKISDADLDRVDVKIEEAPPLGKLSERKVPKIDRRPLRKIGRLDPAVLSNEVAERFRDFEICRVKVARIAHTPLEAVPAGQVSAHWTVLPSGRTRGTLLFENTETDLAVLKCSRRAMNRWRFTAPQGGPVDVEFDYEFSPRRP